MRMNLVLTTKEKELTIFVNEDFGDMTGEMMMDGSEMVGPVMEEGNSSAIKIIIPVVIVLILAGAVIFIVIRRNKKKKAEKELDELDI